MLFLVPWILLLSSFSIDVCSACPLKFACFGRCEKKADVACDPQKPMYFQDFCICAVAPATQQGTQQRTTYRIEIRPNKLSSIRKMLICLPLGLDVPKKPSKMPFGTLPGLPLFGANRPKTGPRYAKRPKDGPKSPPCNFPTLPFLPRAPSSGRPGAKDATGGLRKPIWNLPGGRNLTPRGATFALWSLFGWDHRASIFALFEALSHASDFRPPVWKAFCLSKCSCLFFVMWSRGRRCSASCEALSLAGGLRPPGWEPVWR